MNSSAIPRAILVMRRTLSNLDYIKQKETDEGPYYVTQLLNSFLGALVHPWEEYGNKLIGLSLDSDGLERWGKVKKEYPEDVDPENYGHLIKLMRHGMAHGNVTMLPAGDTEIEKIRIVNIDPRCGHRVWGAVISIEDARGLLNELVAVIEKFGLLAEGEGG